MSNFTEQELEVLVGHREEQWSVDVLDYTTENLLHTLNGVEDGTFDFSVFDTIRSGGSLEVDPQVDTLDWGHIKLQLWYSPSPAFPSLRWPWGVFLPGTPASTFDEAADTVKVELYDKLLILARDLISETWSPDSSISAVRNVRALIQSTGETKIRMLDAGVKAPDGMVFDAGKYSKLQIINELLDSVGYTALSVDGMGFFQAAAYVAPQYRGTAWDFVDDPRVSVYQPSFSHEQDMFHVPNKVVIIGQSEGDLPPLVGVAEDTDVRSPWSYQNRNNQWVTVTEHNDESVSQELLDAKAAHRLASLQRATSEYVIKHAPLPLSLNDVVLFRHSRGISVRAVVQKMRVTLGLGDDVRTTLREVKWD